MLSNADDEPLVTENDGEVNAGSIVTVAGVSVAVIPMPFAIPPATLKPAIDNEYIWKDASQVFGRAKGHVLVAVINPENDTSEQFNRARVLTIVTAAVLSIAEGVGVFWQSAECVIQPKRFFAEAQTIGSDKTASSLWFSLRFYAGSSDPDSNLLVCQSTGLAVFLGREIECGPYALMPHIVAEKVVLAARFMATAGPVFGEGHTLGMSETEKPDAQLFLDWSALGGINKPIFQLRLLAEEGVLQ
jgi:hypothetical protein